MDLNLPTIPTPSFTAPEDLQKFLAEFEAMKAKAAELEAENKVFKDKEAKKKEEESLKKKIKDEARFFPVRNTLVLRRTTDHDLIAPARDVFDYIELYDLKKPVTAEGKKTKVSEDELKVYQELKAEGFTDITPKMVAGKVKPTKEGDNESDQESDNEGGVPM